ncbi:MAG: hypothetical protein M0010_11875 [Actinomycetota bacterium]|jgi:hypothetical protein|nr:hypothetical protein [Actinomycetota bacterium]
MGTRQGPRRPLPQPHRAALAQPLADAVVGPARHGATGSDLDVAPLLVALRAGALDAHLPEIARIVNDRLAAIEAIEELIAASKLHVGDKVRLGHNLKPSYLHGRPATILEKDGDKWIVRLDEPITGKFANADLRLSARQLEPA